MLSSMSFKSLSIAVAALGFSNITPPGGDAQMATRPFATVGPAIDMPAGARSLTLKKAPDGLFYVNARVNDASVRFVVDTGANVVVLTHADAKAAGIAPASKAAPQRLRTAGGRQAMRWASIRDLTIAGRKVPNTDAVVVAAGGPPHSLLGQSALARFESVTLRGNELELKI